MPCRDHTEKTRPIIKIDRVSLYIYIEISSRHS